MAITSDSKNLVPPEGGWGWMTVLSVAICNIAAIPPMTFFGFVFKGISDELHLPMMQIALIITTNISLGLILNVILVPLIQKEYVSRRKVALFGALLVVLSYIGIAYSQTLLHVILSFSIVLAIGVKLVVTASSETMKSYFVKVRRKVNKIALLSIALGGMSMAPFMAYLITAFKSRVTMLVLSGTSLSLFFAAILLQPVKYHLVEEIVDQEMETFVTNQKSTKVKVNGSVENGVSSVPKQPCENNSTKETKSLLNSKNKYIIIPAGKDKNLDIASIHLSQENVTPDNTLIRQTPTACNIYMKLLTNPIYLCVAVGIILNTLAESLFGALLPFMLYQFKFNAMDVGIGIACFSSAMIIMKYIALYYRPKKQISARVICILCIVVLIGSRIAISLGFMNCFRNLLIAAIVIGSSKGFLLGYIEDTVSEVVSSEEEEYAFNITNLVSGILLVSIAPFAAQTRDTTGSFQKVMLFINGMNSSVLILWTAQLLISVCIDMYKVSKKPYQSTQPLNSNNTTQ